MQFKMTEVFTQARAVARVGYARLVLVAVLSCVCTGLLAQQTEEELNEPILFVNDHVVKKGEFEAFFNFRRRPSSYHDNPLSAELEAARAEAMRDLVNRLVLLDEARRRGLQADPEIVDASIHKAKQRYQDQPDWAENKDDILLSMRQQLEDGDLIRQLEAIVRDVADPTEQSLLTYFESNPDTFTEPRQRKVSLILIGVDPAGPKQAWQRALGEAEALIVRLNKGADFAALAGELSTDYTRQNGGSMGYLHDGMLSDAAETALSAVQMGQISEPVRTLEGYAIFRLDDVREPVKKTLEQVRERAIVLWKRAEAERAWNTLVEGLRHSAVIDIKDPSLNKDPEEAGV